jgi:hypothetical protein
MQYLFNVLVKYIEKVSANNVVQLHIDNATNMRNIVEILMFHFPKL